VPLAIGLIALVGAVLLLGSGITDASFADVLTGKAGQIFRENQTPATSSGSSSSAPGSGSPNTSTVNVPAGSLPALPYGTALTGAAAKVWAASILKALSAPVTSANVSSLEDWFEHEGGGGQNNPLNTTLETSNVVATINSAGVRSYSTPAAGVAATAQTLLGSGYSAIVSALRAGTGLANAGGAVSSELSTWSEGGYSSL